MPSKQLLIQLVNVLLQPLQTNLITNESVVLRLGYLSYDASKFSEADISQNFVEPPLRGNTVSKCITIPITDGAHYKLRSSNVSKCITSPITD